VSSKHHEREDVYAVLRADLFLGVDVPLESLITVKEVVRSQALAEAEVDRLNAARPDGRVRYWYQHSRLYPPGRSAGSVEAPA
jgi:hypothetical protein